MLFVAFGRIVQMALIFATIKIATTLLPPEEMAKVYLVGATVAFFALLLLNPVGMFMNRRLHVWNANGKVTHYYNYFWLYLLAVCVVAEISLLIMSFFGWESFHTTMACAMLLVGGSLLFATVNQVVIPGLNLLGYRGWFVTLTLATALISLVLAIIFVIGFEPKAEYWIVGLFLGQLVVGVIGLKVFYSKLNTCQYVKKTNKQHIQVLLSFAWPISIAVGLGWFQTQSYRFLVESSLGLHALGLFAAGYGISAGLISAFESVFATYLQPKFYRHISNENLAEQGKAWSEYAGSIFPSMILLGFVVVGVAPELTHVMLGHEYWSSSQFIVWGVIAELARVASGVYGMVAHARMNTKLLIAPSLVGALLSVGLIWWLMPIYKSNGVGVALMISSVIACLLTYTFTRNEYASVLPRELIIKSLYMGVAIVLLAELLRWVLVKNTSVVKISVLLFIVSSTFLFFQYILLRPVLKRNQTNG